jgi:hypothetical protein
MRLACGRSINVVSQSGDPDVYARCGSDFTTRTPVSQWPTRYSYDYTAATAHAETLTIQMDEINQARWCLVSVYAWETETTFFITATIQYPSPPPTMPAPSPHQPRPTNCATYCTRWTCDASQCRGCGQELGCTRSPPPPPLVPYERHCDGSCFFISEYLEADEGSKNQFIECIS